MVREAPIAIGAITMAGVGMVRESRIMADAGFSPAMVRVPRTISYTLADIFPI